MNIRIRQVKKDDLDAVVTLEAACFPKTEAASCASIKERIDTFPESFFVAESDNQVIGMINGCVTDHPTITDDLFENIAAHNPKGCYQSVFGLDVLPHYRGNGIASILMTHLIHKSMDHGCEGIILTCKEHLIGFYESFGYQNLGVSDSVHGGAVWYDMVLTF